MGTSNNAVERTMNPTFLTRRHALKNMACGFGYLAFAGLAAERAFAVNANPLAPKAPHFKPRAKRVIFIFMQGGPSHVDTFDYKPLLAEQDGKMMSFDDARNIANTGARGTSQRVMKSPWKFAQHGQTGHWVSELFPEMAKHVDDLCFIHSMHTEGVAHGPATLFLHCGSTTFRPAVDGRVGQLRPRHGERESAGLRGHCAADGQWRPAQLRQRLSAAGLSRHRDRQSRACRE